MWESAAEQRREIMNDAAAMTERVFSRFGLRIEPVAAERMAGQAAATAELIERLSVAARAAAGDSCFFATALDAHCLAIRASRDLPGGRRS
jgi:hypothetical protein